MIRYLRHMVLVATLLIPPTGLMAEPWSEKLGYPPGRPVVILNACELGICWEMNEATQRLLESGHLSSAGVVVTGPRFKDIARWSRQHSEHDLGISVALTNPYEVLSWCLLTPERGPTTLVDADGFPWQTVVQFALNAHADDVKEELDAQVSRMRQAGIQPTHISGYYGTVFSRTDLAGVVLGASRKYWLPAPVVELTPTLIERFRLRGIPVDAEMQELVANYPLPKLDDLRFSPPGENYEQKRDRFCELIQTLVPGLTQIVLRPATESPGLQSLTADWQQRVWDARLLSDEKVAAMMQQQGVIVTNWRDVMRRFDSGPSLTTEITQPAESAE